MKQGRAGLLAGDADRGRQRLGGGGGWGGGGMNLKPSVKTRKMLAKL